MADAPTATAPHVDIQVYGDFRSIITAVNPTWELGGFTLPDATAWKYREPNATVIVEGDRLRVRANPLTRSHDKVQVLDNAKHMYYSTFLLAGGRPDRSRAHDQGTCA